MPDAPTTPELTVMMPCLNEARSLAGCILLRLDPRGDHS